MSIFVRIASILILFGIFSWPLSYVKDPESPAYKKMRENSKQQLDFAIVGDSRSHAGISPSIITATVANSTGRKVSGFNFSVDGTDSIHHISFILNGLLALPKPPSTIIWATHALHFDGHRANNRLEQLKASDFWPLLAAGAPHEMLLDIFTMAWFKPWQHRPLVASVVSDYTERAGIRTIPVQTKLLRLHYEKTPDPRKYFDQPDGFTPFEVYAWKKRFDQGAKSYLGEYASLENSTWHYTLAENMIRKATAAGIKFVVVEVPVAPWAQTNLLTNPKHQFFRTKLSQSAATANAHYLDHSSLYKDDQQFGDPGHMERKTAEHYSTQLANELVRINAI